MMTQHFLERAYERVGMDPVTAEEFGTVAFRKGKHAAQMPKYEREYMERRECGDVTTRYYKNCIFIFSGADCVTMFNVPDWFEKRKMPNQRRYQNPRKLVRCCCDGGTFMPA